MRFLSLVLLLPLSAFSIAFAQSRLYVADAAGNAVLAIDPQSDRVAASIPVSGSPQGVVVSTDARDLYVTSSLTNLMNDIDLRTLRVVKSAEVGLRPGCLAVAPDGRHAFVCVEGEAGLDVVDTAPMQKIRTIDLPGKPSNLYVTPDSTRIIATGDKRLTVINIRSEETEFTIPVDGEVEALAIDSDKDLVIHRLFLELAGMKGFEVIDYAARKLAAKVALPAAVSALEVTPDRKSLWVASGDALTIFPLPDLKKTATVPVGRGPAAIVCSSDSKRCFISNAGDGTVSVVDAVKAKEIQRIPAGKSPGRMVMVDGAE